MPLVYRLFNLGFGIKKEEFSLVQLFLLYITIICTAYTITSTAAITLFLSRVHEEELRQLLPWLYISIAITTFAVAGLYGKLIDRFSRIKLITATTFFFIASFLLIRTMMFIIGDQAWLYFFLMVWDETCAVVLIMVFYSYLGDYFYVHNAKRLYGYIGGGFALGAPLGGFGSVTLLNYLSPPNLLFISAILLGLSNFIALVIWNKAAAPRRVIEGKIKSSPILLKKIYQSPYLRAIFVIVITASIVTSIEVYQLFYIASQTLHEQALGVFMGKLFGYIGIAQLIINFLLAKWLLRNFGVIKNLLILPFIFILLSLGFIIYPVLFFAASMKFVDAAVSGTLGNLATQMLLLPLSERMRIQSQAILTGVVGTAASVIGGVILIVFSYFLVPIRYYAVPILIASVIRVFYTLKLFPMYKKVLGTSIAGMENDPYDLELLLNNKESKAIINKLIVNNKTENILVILYAMSLPALERIKLPIKNLLNYPNSTLVADALRILGYFPDKDNLMLIRPFLLDQRPNVLAGAIESFCKLAKSAALPKIKHYIDSESAEVVKETLVGSYRYCGAQGQEFTREALKNLIEKNPLKALEVIKEIKEPLFVTDLQTYLTGDDIQLKKAAIAASGNYPDPSIIKLLLQLLESDKQLRPYVERSLTVMGQTIVPAIELALKQESLSNRAKYTLLIVLGKIGGQSALRIILETLYSKHSELLLLAVVHALNNLYLDRKLPAADFSKLDNYINRLIEYLQLLKSAYQEMGDMQNAARKYFYDTFYFYMDILFSLVAIQYDIKEMVKIKNTLYSNSNNTAATLDLLETVLPKHRLQQIQPLLLPSLEKGTFTAKSPSVSLLKSIANIDPWLEALTAYFFKGVITMPDHAAKDNLYFEYIDIITFLKGVALFSDIPTNYLINIAEAIHKQKYFSGEVLMQEGSESRGIFIIKSGRVQIVKNNVNINLLGVNEYIGELTILDQLPNPYTVKAIEDVEIFFISEIDFQNVLEMHPEVSRALLKMLAGRLRNLLPTKGDSNV